MYVNKIPFFMSISRNLQFGTAEKVGNRKIPTILESIKQISNTYAKRGFRVKTILGNNEFEPIRGSLAKMGIDLNVAAADEYVPQVERYIRTVKERSRSIYNTLPFKKLPALLVVSMVYFSVLWLNMFPATQGISSNVSPQTIITGPQPNFDAHCKVEFGSYAQTHEQHDNSMHSRTTGAICLGPAGNSQGGYHFMSLTTGKKLHRYRWTELPMPAEVIDCVHVLARRKTDGLLFADGHGNPIADPGLAGVDDNNDDDSDYDRNDDSDANSDYNPEDNNDPEVDNGNDDDADEYFDATDNTADDDDDDNDHAYSDAEEYEEYDDDDDDGSHDSNHHPKQNDDRGESIHILEDRNVGATQAPPRTTRAPPSTPGVT